MILKNFAIAHAASQLYYSASPSDLIMTNGSVDEQSSGAIYLSEPSSGAGYVNEIAESNYGSSRNGCYFIALGGGTTQPTLNDYAIETVLDTSKLDYKNMDASRTGGLVNVTCTITNTADVDFTFSECAIVSCQSGQSDTTARPKSLLTRDVFSPVTIGAGKSKTITIAIDFAAMATSVA